MRTLLYTLQYVMYRMIFRLGKDGERGRIHKLEGGKKNRRHKEQEQDKIHREGNRVEDAREG